jgi:hypothetical protein
MAAVPAAAVTPNQRKASIGIGFRESGMIGMFFLIFFFLRPRIWL